MTGETIHATCVAFADIGILLRGPSGAGKSDLALRLIDAGAVLVADDRVALIQKPGDIVARPPEALAGRLEVRGVGVCVLPQAGAAPLKLVCDLGGPDRIQRLPKPGWCEYLGVRIRRMDVAPFEASAAVKLRVAAYSAVGRRDPVSGARIACEAGLRDNRQSEGR